MQLSIFGAATSRSRKLSRLTCQWSSDIMSSRALRGRGDKDDLGYWTLARLLLCCIRRGRARGRCVMCNVEIARRPLCMRERLTTLG